MKKYAAIRYSIIRPCFYVILVIFLFFAEKKGYSQPCYPRTNQTFLITSNILNLRSNPSKSSHIKRVLNPKEHHVEVKNQDSVIDSYILVYVLYWDSFSTINQEWTISVIDSGWVYMNYLNLSGDDRRFILKTGSLDDEAKAYAIEIIRKEDSLFLSENCKYNPSKIAYAYRKLGDIYLNKQDYKTAIINFTKSINASTDNSLEERVLSFYGRALAKINLSDFYGARTDLNQLLPYKSNVSYFPYLLAWGSKSSCWVSLENVYLRLAACDANLGEYYTALNYISIILSNNNKLGYAYFLKAQILLAQNQKKEACKAASTAGELGIMESYDFISQNCQ